MSQLNSQKKQRGVPLWKLFILVKDRLADQRLQESTLSDFRIMYRRVNKAAPLSVAGWNLAFTRQQPYIFSFKLNLIDNCYPTRLNGWGKNALIIHFKVNVAVDTREKSRNDQTNSCGFWGNPFKDVAILKAIELAKR